MKFKNIWLFLPCHNEEENLEPLVEKLFKLKIPNFHLVIIDDVSTDKTGRIADQLARRNKKIKVVHRQGLRGRALAGKTGFEFCLKQKADVIAEMDADFSHQPKYLPLMLRELDKGKVDVVLGSRFVKGGKDCERNIIRIFLSKLSGFFFRLILGIKVKDMGSGYKVYKSEVIKAIKPQNFFAEKGLAISMESIFRSIKAGYKIKEIPITFKKRRAGYSKLKLVDFFEPIYICFKLVLKLGRV